MLVMRPYNPRGVRQGTLSLRTSGDNRLPFVGGPNVCSAEGRPPFAKRFRGHPQV